MTTKTAAIQQRRMQRNYQRQYESKRSFWTTAKQFVLGTIIVAVVGFMYLHIGFLVSELVNGAPTASQTSTALPGQLTITPLN